ncbi:MAG: SDR family oxidoreductase [Proteobacteria bacterium]|jgi:3-oxoacyl-[acyl-carrier protein] reductase|nr:SDR family oxidoreductase [Pseudomonadota bacterium]MDA1300057.1 SDR family oxidoreductase [Pseudomonadota bacterium]
MDLGVSGKVAIITGGSNGIGRAAAERLSREGALVALVSRTQADLDQVAGEISGESGHEVIGIATDVRSEDSVKAMVQMVADKWGRIDILVNNAGTSSAARFDDMTNEQIEEDFTLKVMGAIYCTRHALPYLKAGRGAICNTTTPGGKAPGAGSQPTALSRASGISLTKTWSKEFAADGVRVNTVCVGLLKSRQHKLRWVEANKTNPDYTLDEHYQNMGRGVPLGRVGEAAEAGDVIAFLCSDVASYVTGTAINVDGGVAPVV